MSNKNNDYRKLRRWTEETMQEALMTVRVGTLTINQAADRYGIPLNTLKYRINANISLDLPTTIETKLADNLKFMERHGFKTTIKDKLELIGAYVNSVIPSRFKEPPSLKWFSVLSDRNDLKASPNEFTAVKDYFAVLKDTIEEHDLKDDKIWFIDETGFDFNQERITRGDAKEKNATVLTACNAAGQKGPAFILFRKNNRPSDLVSNDEACYAVSEDGWLNKSEFRNYFTTTFLRYLRNSPPILIALNGCFQIDIQLIEESRQANVIFIKIPELLKEYSIFAGLKRKWETNLPNFKSVYGKQFCKMIIDGLNNFTVDEIKENFRKAGIYPFDCNVTAERCAAEFVERWTNNKLSLAEEVDQKELDSAPVNLFDDQFVKEEPEESMSPEYEGDYVEDEIPNEDFAGNSASSILRSLLEGPKETPAALKRPTTVSETLLTRITKHQHRPRNSQTATKV